MPEHHAHCLNLILRFVKVMALNALILQSSIVGLSVMSSLYVQASSTCVNYRTMSLQLHLQ